MSRATSAFPSRKWHHASWLPFRNQAWQSQLSAGCFVFVSFSDVPVIERQGMMISLKKAKKSAVWLCILDCSVKYWVLWQWLTHTFTLLAVWEILTLNPCTKAFEKHVLFPKMCETWHLSNTGVFPVQVLPKRLMTFGALQHVCVVTKTCIMSFACRWLFEEQL